jgi:hypothetical protein
MRATTLRRIAMRSGLIAEFVTAEALERAVRALTADGYRELDAFTPRPVHEVEEALALPRSRLNWLVFIAGSAAAAFAFALQWWCNAVDYPLNVGGRNNLATPAFIIITFEIGVLVSALTAVGVLFFRLGLPRLSDPVFAVDGFERATLDRFWLAVAEDDPRLSPGETRRALEQLGAVQVAPFGALAQRSDA